MFRFSLKGEAVPTLQSKIPYDLSKITEFRRDLIYDLFPESSEQFSPTEQPLQCLAHYVGQITDAFDGYYYAQTTILPYLKENGIENVTPELFIGWLKELHKRFARALAVDINMPHAAGQYAREEILRWKQTLYAESAVIACFINEEATTKAEINEILYQAQSLMNAPEAEEKEEFKKLIENGTYYSFILLLKKLYNDKKIKLSETQQSFIPKLDENNPRLIYSIALNKLAHQVHVQGLSLDEKKIVDHIVKICISPEDFEAAMKEFSVDFINKWKVCKSSDLNQILSIAQQAFYMITEIHPFFNANGRTATCIVNLLLRYFNYPSILVRKSSEFEDNSSTYNLAIQTINTEPQNLINHFRSRLYLVLPDENSIKANFVAARVRYIEILNAVKKTNPNLNLSSLSHQITDANASQSLVYQYLRVRNKIFELKGNKDPRILALLPSIAKPYYGIIHPLAPERVLTTLEVDILATLCVFYDATENLLRILNLQKKSCTQLEEKEDKSTASNSLYSISSNCSFFGLTLKNYRLKETEKVWSGASRELRLQAEDLITKMEELKMRAI